MPNDNNENDFKHIETNLKEYNELKKTELLNQAIDKESNIFISL